MTDPGHFRLRAMQTDDIERVYHWRTRPEIARFMFSDDVITLDLHRDWFLRTLEREDVDYRILEYRGEPVGLANATDIDPQQRSCHWGFYIGDSDAPRGSGTVMAGLMIEHIFTTHPVDTIWGEAFSYNTASLKLHHRLGFETHPELGRTVEKQGQPEQVEVMSLQRTGRTEA